MSEAGGPGPGDPTSEEHVGSVAEEALKLVGALSDWARDHGADLGQGLGQGLGQQVGGLVDQAVAAAHDVDEHLATGAAECTYCPICRAVHVVRRTSPEVRAHLATAASSLLQAAAGLLATAVPDEARGNDAGVERIDLDDDTDGAWPEEDDE